MSAPTPDEPRPREATSEPERVTPGAAPLAGVTSDSKVAGANRGGSQLRLASRLRDLSRHLSFRLFLVLFGLLTLLQAIHTGLLLREQKQQLMDSVLLSADRVGDVIQRSTRSTMLRNQRTELHEMIENIGTQPGFDGVRIFNKMGHIMFSTDAAEISEVVDKQAEACWRCHAEGDPPPTLDRHDRARIFVSADGHRTLGLISPILNAPDCSSAACHAHSPEQTVLGVLDVRMSLAQVDAELAATQRHMRDASLALVLAVALAFGLAIQRMLQAPVSRLLDATRAVSAGRLDHRIQIRSENELGTLADSFNHMTHALQQAQEENESWAFTLEDKVRQKTEELRRAQAHLMQMDRMASLGRLAATVAHEINNPLAGILTYARLLERELQSVPCEADGRADMQRYIGTIGTETRRCGDIVQNLLSFARTSGTQMAPVQLHALVESSLALVQHHFDLNEIRVVRKLDPGEDEVVCDAGEIRQALLALLVNAGESMSSGGQIAIETRIGPQEVEVAVTDAGCGIPPDVLPRIFEPFYTTKSATKGVGLGLAVVYGIMHRHDGRVEVRSKPDEGSTFKLIWSRRPRTGTANADVTAGAGGNAGGTT
jgi:two-component system, NtrC family, sensor kinase